MPERIPRRRTPEEIAEKAKREETIRAQAGARLKERQSVADPEGGDDETPDVPRGTPGVADPAHPGTGPPLGSVVDGVGADEPTPADGVDHLALRGCRSLPPEGDAAKSTEPAAHPAPPQAPPQEVRLKNPITRERSWTPPKKKLTGWVKSEPWPRNEGYLSHVREAIPLYDDLTFYRNSQTGLAWPKIETLCNDLGVGHEAIQGWRRQLVWAGLVEVLTLQEALTFLNTLRLKEEFKRDVEKRLKALKRSGGRNLIYRVHLKPPKPAPWLSKHGQTRCRVNTAGTVFSKAGKTVFSKHGQTRLEPEEGKNPLPSEAQKKGTEASPLSPARESGATSSLHPTLRGEPPGSIPTPSLTPREAWEAMGAAIATVGAQPEEEQLTWLCRLMTATPTLQEEVSLPFQALHAQGVTAPRMLAAILEGRSQSERRFHAYHRGKNPVYVLNHFSEFDHPDWAERLMDQKATQVQEEWNRARLRIRGSSSRRHGMKGGAEWGEQT